MFDYLHEMFMVGVCVGIGWGFIAGMLTAAGFSIYHHKETDR